MAAARALILASASPRRAQLLRDARIPFTVAISPIAEPEKKPADIPVELWPMALAFIKATAVHNSLPTTRRRRIILAADTIVILGHGPRAQILNKPRDRAHARRMLQSLSGQAHRVITGIALLSGEKTRLASATAACRMKKFSPAALQKYLDSNLWQGKAGAYGIQDGRDPFVELIAGEFSTVVGLPLSLVQSELAAFAKD